MTRTEKKPITGMTLGVLGLGATGYAIINLSPDRPLVEVAVMVLGFFSCLMITSWLLGSGKWGMVGTTAIFGILALNRFQLLDPLTLATLTIILVLIYLKN